MAVQKGIYARYLIVRVLSVKPDGELTEGQQSVGG